MDSTEHDTYRAAIHGDRDAFEMIIRSQSRALFAIAYGILQNRAEAEDVVQDALVKAWKTRWRVRDPEKFPAWLGTITRHRARDVARRHRTVPFPAEADEPIDPQFEEAGQTFKRRGGQRTGARRARDPPRVAPGRTHPPLFRSDGLRRD